MDFKTFTKNLKGSKLLSNAITFIPHLKTIYNESPELIEEIFKQPVVIVEKQDGKKFSVVKTAEGKIEYWSKNQPIDKIMRIVNGSWDKLIERLDVLRKKTNNFSELSNGSEISGEFFGEAQENVVQYAEAPKGNWVVYFANIKGKLHTSVSYKELWKWADYFEAERQPIIYVGVLDADKVDKITEFLRMSDEERLEQFKSNNFTQYLLNILNPDYKGTQIEGVVLYTQLEQVPLVKIVDPVFSKTNKEKWDKNKDVEQQFKRELFEVVYPEVESLAGNLKNTYSLDLKGLNSVDQYLFLIDKLFLLLMNNNKDIINILNQYQELERPDSELGEKYIKPRIWGHISNSWKNKQLYIILLMGFRKQTSSRRAIYKNIDIIKFNTIVQLLYGKGK